MEIGIQIVQEIRQELEQLLDRCGIMYRLFARGKSIDSIEHKIAASPGKYSPEGKKIQDGLGFRIVFYFLEDVKTICNYLMAQHTIDTYEEKSDSEAELKENEPSGVKYVEIFRPQRLNLIFRMHDSRAKLYSEELQNTVFANKDTYKLIDTTYEIQLRSVLSEGWHEIEHDLRYKCKGAHMWEYCESESRSLNGIYASLETNEVAMELLFERMAYLNYKSKDWEDMLRNHFRIRIHPYKNLSQNNIRVLNDDPRTAKRILGISRTELHLALLGITTSFPINYDNLLFLANRMLGKNANELIVSFEPLMIKEKLDRIYHRDI
ncbi:RelA/SpoT domain-containing protein [Bacteroides acidifaciens]|uniref:RelA/SpoT domain-containing protein n=1 Tax=Bacteroides acidifaciens TaxID=85831 RepID=UPI002621DE49|nr:RelA/SpoT domain-containing protein [Bacteroides acidifaciens]